MRHQDIWYSIDVLAENYGVSTSKLARLAGLDPTTFNKSKRIGKDGKKRWPSTESIAKVLEVTGSHMNDIVSILDDGEGAEITNDNTCDYMIPLLEMELLQDVDKKRSFFDSEGIPVNIKENWDGLETTQFVTDDCFAMEVSGDEMTPFYSDGDVLIISAQASIRNGDRIIIQMSNGNLFVKEFKKQTANALVVSGEEDIRYNKADVVWFSKVMWVSQ
ncbi:MAG: helix-turn-helix transcriptional regulator [Alphaproteobacteria bacterium]|nr:helix-turn-helix transcriptional regulator [Alphaproteobacteria bacterium]